LTPKQTQARQPVLWRVAMLKIIGLDELRSKLNDLASKTQTLAGQHDVPLRDLLNPEFMVRHTRFGNINDMFAASGFNIESREDLAAVPDEQWDEFIRSVSTFSDWQSLLGEATRVWVG
jgi:hypothetical protein